MAATRRFNCVTESTDSSFLCKDYTGSEIAGSPATRHPSRPSADLFRRSRWTLPFACASRTRKVYLESGWLGSLRWDEAIAGAALIGHVVGRVGSRAPW